MEVEDDQLESQDSVIERLLTEDSLEKALERVTKDYQGDMSSQDLVTTLKFYANILVQQGKQLQKPVWRFSQPELCSVHVRPQVLELIGLLVQYGADVGCRFQLHTDLLYSLNLHSTYCKASGISDSFTDARPPLQSEYITCLGLAVALSDVSLVELMLSAGTDISSVCLGDQTAVQLSMSRRLLGNFEDWGIDSPSMVWAYSGESPKCNGHALLHVAVLQGNLHMIDLLLKHGSDIDGVNYDGVTPLGLSLSLPMGGAVAEHLLRQGCDKYKESTITRLDRKFTPWCIACYYGKVNLLHYWLPERCTHCGRDRGVAGHSPSEAQNRACDSCPHYSYLTPLPGLLTPFLMAVWGGTLSAVSHLSSVGMDISAYCSMGNAVHLAVLSEELAVLLHVMDSGCDIDMVDSKGNTPLHLAARLKNSDLCQALIQRGACLNVQDKNGETALSSSIYFGCEKNSLLLIQHCADLNCADKKWTTPLYWSVYTCRPYTLEKLIEAGVQCSGKSFGRFPRNLSIMQNKEFIDWLQNQLCQPKSLQQQCSLAIRNVLRRKSCGRSIAHMVQSLPLPKKMKSRVNLTHDNVNSDT
ncbi:serine/threonine-protein phosphatase 6 regulatory ankyrin repeat subunit B-like [Liolophura sinensis]|uniref:serine/threonine-protein phosphatase 6 regulatory ankyrin repeat subunit B-like n=1 Tax=Liolophura sinensis TaxID=3198878 RepID=UPI0031583972